MDELQQFMGVGAKLLYGLADNARHETADKPG